MYLGTIVESRRPTSLYAVPLHPYTIALLSAVPIPDPEVEDRGERILLHGRPAVPAQPAARLPLPHPLPVPAGPRDAARRGAAAAGGCAPATRSPATSRRTPPTARRRRPPRHPDAVPGRPATAPRLPTVGDREDQEGARRDQAGLVGEDHRLHAVAQPQLGEHVADVGLDRRLADHQLGGDLRVGHALGDQPQHLQLPLGQPVQPRRGRLLVGRGQPCARTCPAAAGSRSAPRSRRPPPPPGSPAPARPAARPSAGTRWPPARSASTMYSSRSKVVSTSTLGTCAARRRLPHDPAGRLDAVHAGHPDVHQHHVGQQRPRLLLRGLARPRPRPTTVRSGSASRISRNPVRSSGWSSTSSTLIVIVQSLSGKPRAHLETAPGRGPMLRIPP